MFRVLNCLATEHDWRLVMLAGLVCFLASLAAVSMFHRARANSRSLRAFWTASAGFSTGCGIWATHFIAILAYSPGMPIAFDVGLTVLSLLSAVVVTTAGLAIAVYGAHRRSAAIGGGFVGGAVASMHYLGMAALQLPGRVTWQADLVTASIVLGIVFGALAMTVASRSDNVRGTLNAALLLTLSIVLHHFTAMGAVVILPDPTRIVEPSSITPMSLALAIAGLSIAVLGISIIGAVTDRRLSDTALEAAARFHGLAEATTEALLIYENDVIIDVNSSLERLVGATAAELTGHRVASLFHGANTAPVLRNKPIEVQVITATGERVLCEAIARTIPGRDTVRVVISLRDLRERKKAEARIVHLAHHDPLTDLPNRASFNERLQSIIESSQRLGTQFAVLCVDFDRFKEVNDLFGHMVGDLLLQETAARMYSVTDGAFLARLGSDEFTLLAEGLQPTTAEALAARLKAVMAEDIVIDGREIRVGLSIGVAIYPHDGTDAQSLLVHADAALYRAKADGRGAVRFFEADMDKRLRERRTLELELRQALARGEIELHYQPQARIDGTITGFEALARWNHPTRGRVPPSEFIPLAEETGLIIPLGEWILKEACREAASWPNPLQLAVNLSPVQFSRGNLPGLVHLTLLETGLAANRLELEITEGVLVEDIALAGSILRQLKALGIRIAMDDFGTGYSSLSYLQSFPFDKIKIDRAFISSLSRGNQSEAIVRAVIGLGRGLDLPVMAEGVETKEQHDFLRSADCDEMQGYLIGKPQPIDAYAEITGATPEPEPRRATG